MGVKIKRLERRIATNPWKSCKVRVLIEITAMGEIDDDLIIFFIFYHITMPKIIKQYW